MWFTETPWPPVVALLAGAGILGFVWSRTRKRGVAAAAGLCVLLAAGAYLLERAIVTPGEEVEGLVTALRDAVVAGDVERTLDFLSQSAEGERSLAKTALERVDVRDDLRITDLSVETLGEGSQALSHFRANGTVEPQGFGAQRVATRWEVSWRREGGAWKIYKIVRLNPINGDPINWMAAD